MSNFSDMTSMEVEHVLANYCIMAWFTSRWNGKDEGVMRHAWKFSMVMKVSWRMCRGPGSSVRLPLVFLA